MTGPTVERNAQPSATGAGGLRSPAPDRRRRPTARLGGMGRDEAKTPSR